MSLLSAIDTGDPGQDLLATVQQYNDFIEQLVRRHPEQWFGWLHNRWKIKSRFKEEARSFDENLITGLRKRAIAVYIYNNNYYNIWLHVLKTVSDFSIESYSACVSG